LRSSRLLIFGAGRHCLIVKPENMWHDLWVALALLLVLEGVMPFLAPNTMRRMLLEVARRDSRSLRLAGLASMLGGVGLLYLIN
jgi:uncharacterized protein YjeT (DUF2065 family)